MLGEDHKAIFTNWHRKDRPRRLRQKPLLDVQTLAVESADSSEQIVQRELVEQLYQAIHQLPKTDVALVLLYLDDMSYRKRHPQRPSEPGEPLNFYAQEALTQVEHQIWLLRNVFW